MTPDFTAFYFFDSGAPRTHIAAWDANVKKWVVPCQHVEVPTNDQITYAPTKPLCRTCDRMTRQLDRDVPRRSRTDG